MLIRLNKLKWSYLPTRVYAHFWVIHNGAEKHKEIVVFLKGIIRDDVRELPEPKIK